MSDVQLPSTELLAITDIRPYPNNPRRIPQEAIDKVRSSLEKYGYQQPIVVDTDHVIIVGHTRHAALMQMGVTEVPVYVTDLPAEKASAYRLVDNRTNESSDWDHDALVMELREFEQTLLEEFFPDVDLEINTLKGAMADVTDSELGQAGEALSPPTRRDPLITKVICPSCYDSFSVRTDTLPGLSRADLMELEVADDAADQPN